MGCRALPLAPFLSLSFLICTVGVATVSTMSRKVKDKRAKTRLAPSMGPAQRMPAIVAVGDGTGPCPLSVPASSPALAAACAPAPRFQASARSALEMGARSLWSVGTEPGEGKALPSPTEQRAGSGSSGPDASSSATPTPTSPEAPVLLQSWLPRGGPAKPGRGSLGPGHGHVAWQLLPARKPLNPPHLLPAPAAHQGAPVAAPALALTLQPHAACPRRPLAPRAPSLPPPGASPPQSWTRLN